MNRLKSVTAISGLALASLLTFAYASHIKPLSNHNVGAGKRMPVIVELFTSEGCSSCPSADEVLAQLKRDQPIDGAEIIALSEHVDYWNSIGWADPFSSKDFSTRQSAYARALHLNEVYTPQAVIDGHAEFVGSDKSRAEDEIHRAAHTPKAEVTLTREATTTGDSELHVQIDQAPKVHTGDTADVMLAITEDNLHSNVTRGENSGRKLSHVAVVRQLRRIGSLTEGKPFAMSVPLKLNTAWKRRDLSAVVFVQEHNGAHIIGAAILPIS